MKYRYNPACPCPRCRAHALYGPVILITIGVLFLFDQMGHSRWMDFSNTWPALLIVIGLLVFMEHNAPMAGHTPRGYVPVPPAQVVTGYAPAGTQGPVVTAPPIPPAGALSPGTSLAKPDDTEVDHG